MAVQLKRTKVMTGNKLLLAEQSEVASCGLQ